MLEIKNKTFTFIFNVHLALNVMWYIINLYTYDPSLPLRSKLKMYPARCKSVHKKMAINVIHTAKNRKYMHVGFAIDVIQTAKTRKYIHIELTSCSS
jgi:hypothetical protein